ncbi:hypothetical protein MMC24_007463 [Lignoscripta atroalba]|nr:hypothetical protein [Lignoscripta atroalba]
MISSDFPTANLNLLGNALPAVTALGDRHPVYMLDESREYYRARRPPFVQGKGKTPAGTRKPIVLATEKGLLPKDPVKAEFVSREWNKDDIFWTLDLGNCRWIVKAFGGAPQGGVTYRSWLGPRKNFSKNPIAFSVKRPRASRTTRSLEDDDTEPYNGSPESEDDENSGPADRVKKRRALRSRANAPGMTETDEKDNLPAPDSVDKETTPILVQQPVQLEKSDATHSEGNFSRLKEFVRGARIPKGLRPTKPSKLPARRSTFVESWDYDQNWRQQGRKRKHQSLPESDTSLLKVQKRRKHQHDGAMDREVSHLYSASPPTTRSTKPHNTSASVHNPPEVPPSEPTPPVLTTDQPTADLVTASSSVNNIIDISTLAPGETMPSNDFVTAEASTLPAVISDMIATCATPANGMPFETSIPTRAPGTSAPTNASTNSFPLETTNPTQPISMPAPTLSAYKQSHTTLRVSLPHSPTSYVPLKLRSCMTMSSFTTNVLAACDLEDLVDHKQHQNPRDANLSFEIRFGWLPCEEQVMVVKGKVEDSFQEMLEIVEEAPCWGKIVGGVGAGTSGEKLEGKEEETGRCTVRVAVVIKGEVN